MQKPIIMLYFSVACYYTLNLFMTSATTGHFLKVQICFQVSDGLDSSTNEKRIFLCRMNVSRNARRQMRFGDQKVNFLNILNLQRCVLLWYSWNSSIITKPESQLKDIFNKNWLQFLFDRVESTTLSSQKQKVNLKNILWIKKGAVLWR